MTRRRRTGPGTTGVALLLSHSAQPSGAEHVLGALVEDGRLLPAFRELGVRTEVVSSTRPVIRAKRDTGFLQAARAAASLVRHGREFGRWADGREVMVARSFKSLLYGAVATGHRKTPPVWSVHGRIAADYFCWAPILDIWFLGRLLAGVCVVNSRATLATLSIRMRPVLLAPPAPGPATLTATPRTSASGLGHVILVKRLSPLKG